MFTIGLTGNVAAGKSTVLALFADWGATVIDADALVREVQTPPSPVLDAIGREFGFAVIRADGSLDRAGLRRLVAGNAEALASLNAIVHPAVQRRRADLQADARRRGDCIVVNDIPLLFEVLDPGAFDAVVLVDAGEDARRRRLVEGRGWTAEEAGRVMASQAPAGPKRQRSDFVIGNDGSLEELERAAWDVWCAVRHAAAAMMWGGGGPLLAMFAHPDDESFATGGTLARYADAGAEVHVWCATAGEAGTLHDPPMSRGELGTMRTDELRRAAEVLGVRQVHRGEFADGTLDPDDPAGPRAAAAVLRAVQPAVVVTFGPDGVTGHPDHRAVHTWVARACDAERYAGPVYYVTYPVRIADATSGRLTGRPDPEIVVHLDVRPWRNVKIASIAAHASQRFPFPLDTSPGADMMEREWYAGTTSAGDVLCDLYERLDPA
jgi:dephospho-CoA kinase